jgi:hypothetical protein
MKTFSAKIRDKDGDFIFNIYSPSARLPCISDVNNACHFGSHVESDAIPDSPLNITSLSEVNPIIFPWPQGPQITLIEGGIVMDSSAEEPLNPKISVSQPK